MTREDLVRALAPELRCACCRVPRPATELEIDHVHGRTWVVSELGEAARVARYIAEYRAGVEMRALCRFCNARGGGRRYYGSRAVARTRSIRRSSRIA